MKPYYERDGITIYHGDCREIIPHIGTVDAVVTDPPYGIESSAAFVRQGGKSIGNGDAGWNTAVDRWAEIASCALRGGGYLAFFFDMRGEPTFPTGVRSWSRYFWVKPSPPPCPRNAFMSAVEVCAIGVKDGGARGWWGGGATPNFWTGLSPNSLRKGVGHPAQKPTGPMLALIGALSPPDGIVLDPFMGSGTTLVAARDLGRKAIGIEIEERYCEVAVKRLSQGVFPFGG